MRRSEGGGGRRPGDGAPGPSEEDHSVAAKRGPGIVIFAPVALRFAGHLAFSPHRTGKEPFQTEIVEPGRYLKGLLLWLCVFFQEVFDCLFHEIVLPLIGFGSEDLQFFNEIGL